MEGYSVTEAASILGVPSERIWELLARGVLAGAPEGETGMRVFLQPRPAPAPPEPRPPNGHSSDADREMSPFRELLTEFRNLTERYGQALLALGESRGEVAALRSRVDLLEARMDLRLPGGGSWSPSPSFPVEHAVIPTAPEPAPAAPTPPLTEPIAGPDMELDEERAEDEVRQRARGPRRATESFAEALARAEDPSPSELPEHLEARARDLDEAVLPREVPAAEAVPVADETILDEVLAGASSFEPVEPVEPAAFEDVLDEDVPTVELEVEPLPPLVDSAVVEEAAFEAPPGSPAGEMADRATVSTAEPEPTAAVANESPMEPLSVAPEPLPPDVAPSEVIERAEAEPAWPLDGEITFEPDAAPEPETIFEPEAAPEPETIFEPEAAPEPETIFEPEAAPEPETSFEAREPQPLEAASIEPPSASPVDEDEPTVAGADAVHGTEPERPTADEWTLREEPTTAPAAEADAEAEPEGGEEAREPAPLDWDAERYTTTIDEPDWFEAEVDDDRAAAPVEPASTVEAEPEAPVDTPAAGETEPPAMEQPSAAPTSDPPSEPGPAAALPGSAELDRALDALRRQAIQASGDDEAWPPELPATDTSVSADATTTSSFRPSPRSTVPPATPAGRAYRRLRRIFPG